MSAKALTEFLEEILPALVDQYGSMSAAVAAEWFEALTGESALLASSVDNEAVRATTRWATGPLFSANPDAVKALRMLSSVVVRHVHQQGRATLHQSVLRAKGVRYMRVPTGAHTCDFCLIMASRGPVYGTKRSAGGEGNSYHSDCDCVPVPVRGEWVNGFWEGETVEGHDHERLYEEEYLPYFTPGDSIKDIARKRRKEATARGRKPMVNKRGYANSLSVRSGGEVLFEEGAVKNSTQQDVETARVLAKHGFKITVKTPVRYQKNPDYLIDGELWEMKAPRGSSEKNTIAGQFKKARKQAPRLILDLVRTGLDESVAIEQAERRFYGQKRITSMMIMTKSRDVLFYIL